MHIRKHALRFSCIFLFFILCLVVFSVKLLLIQFFRSSHLSGLAKRQHNHFITLEPNRGTIFDRQLRPLAVNVAAYSLYANPRQMKDEDKQKAVELLPGLIQVSPETIRERLDRPKYFVWLQRKLPLEITDQIKQLKIKGLAFIKESKRYYPNQELASHVIGFAGMDNEGLEGLELQYDQQLIGKPGFAQILRDAKQRELLLEKSFVPPTDGFSLVLTIDETIQFIAERALEKAFLKHKALSASIIVMDPKTGEILALANQPNYNLAEFGKSKPEDRTNRAVVHVYEPGSVFKIVAGSAALEEEIFTETDKIFCENGEYKIANHILHDHHPHGTLTFKEVIEQSSNIGTAKIAQRMGAENFFKYAKRFRFGEPTGIDLQGEVGGLIKPPSKWSKTTIGIMPIGHEVAVTPLQLVSAISAIANDGLYMRPYVVKYIKDNKDVLIKSFEPQVIDRVISPDTARRMRAILQGVVDNGTGKKAQIKGVTVGGKTGTAQKVINGQYSNSKFFASFIGFAPVDDPKVAVVVVFDEPHPNHFGGTVSAPVFKEVVENALKYLGTQE